MHETTTTTNIIEQVMRCPGLNVKELAQMYNTTAEAVCDTLRAHGLSSFGQRRAKLNTFRRGRLNEWATQVLYPAAPYRICHLDTSLLGIIVGEGGFVRTVEVAVLVDGLTNYVHTCVMDHDEQLATIVNKTLRDGHIWDVYIVDSRIDAIPARQRVESMRKTVVTGVLGSIWNNTRAERIHAYLHRFLMKWPASDYVDEARIEHRLRKFEEMHNEHCSERRVSAPPAALQKQKRQWTKDELIELAAQRGRTVIGAQPFRADFSESDGWAWVLDLEPTNQATRALMNFAEGRAPGFYWGA